MEKWATLGKKGRAWKSGSHLEKPVTFGKTRSRFQKRVTLRKVGHTWKNENVCKNGSPLQNRDTLGTGRKKGHTKSPLMGSWSHLEKGSHFEKWVTLGKMVHSWRKIGYERWPVWRGQNKSKYMVERWSCREVFKIK